MNHHEENRQRQEELRDLLDRVFLPSARRAVVESEVPGSRPSVIWRGPAHALAALPEQVVQEFAEVASFSDPAEARRPLLHIAWVCDRFFSGSDNQPGWIVMYPGWVPFEERTRSLPTQQIPLHYRPVPQLSAKVISLPRNTTTGLCRLSDGLEMAYFCEDASRTTLESLKPVHAGLQVKADIDGAIHKYRHIFTCVAPLREKASTDLLQKPAIPVVASGKGVPESERPFLTLVKFIPRTALLKYLDFCFLPSGRLAYRGTGIVRFHTLCVTSPATRRLLEASVSPLHL